MAAAANSPTIVVLSDIHLGSPWCDASRLDRLLDCLPNGSCLVLNGDTLDRPQRPLPVDHQAVFDRLLGMAARLDLVWVRGNHDDGYQPPAETGLRVVDEYRLKATLLVCHGDRFDNLMPRYRWFLRLFKWLHHLRMRLGAEPVHVARYAKKWQYFYRFLCRQVRVNAIEHAREQGVRAIACGHVHHLEDSLTDGIRYLNTGSWTEPDTHCVVIRDGQVRLVSVAAIIDQGRPWFAPATSLANPIPGETTANHIAKDNDQAVPLRHNNQDVG